MRRFATLVTISTVLLLLLMIAGIHGAIFEKLVFYAHIAQLYSREPDVKIAMPLADVSKKQVANTWHALRGADRIHEGQDIFAPKGTPVLSATSGYIYKIGENNLGGQAVSVIGAGGRIYYYAHLDSYGPGIAEGDPVDSKTVLGYVGTTGNARGTPPHLHFGIYTSSGAINPLPLIVDRQNPTNAPTLTKFARPFASRRLVNRRL